MKPTTPDTHSHSNVCSRARRSLGNNTAAKANRRRKPAAVAYPFHGLKYDVDPRACVVYAALDTPGVEVAFEHPDLATVEVEFADAGAETAALDPERVRATAIAMRLAFRAGGGTLGRYKRVVHDKTKSRRPHLNKNCGCGVVSGQQRAWHFCVWCQTDASYCRCRVEEGVHETENDSALHTCVTCHGCFAPHTYTTTDPNGIYGRALGWSSHYIR